MANNQERHYNLISILNGDQETIREYFKSRQKPEISGFVAFIDDYLASHGLQRSYVKKILSS